MNKNDIVVLRHLRGDGRIALTDLSRRINIPVTTLHDKLRSYLKKGLLKPHSLLNFELMGYLSIAHILLSVDPARKKGLFAYLHEHPNVNNLYQINNGWNLLMEVVFEDMNLLEQFVDELETKFPIIQKQVHYTLNEHKREAFFSKV